VMNSQSKQEQVSVKRTDPPDWEFARRRGIERMLHARHTHVEESANLTSYQGRLRQQREFALWLVDREFDWMLTINTNSRDFAHQEGRTALRKLGALIDRCLLGVRWWRLPSAYRTFFVAVPETAGDELHYHILLRLPQKARLHPNRVWKLRRDLTAKLRRKRIFPSGDAQVTMVNEGDAPDVLWSQFEIACYVAKDIWRSDNMDHYVLSTEFHPSTPS
jgi:hypothetical protein